MKKPHIYANLGQDEIEELFSNFIIDSWSYSKVGTFSRNEKVFEMNYIYRQRSKSSATTIAGQAYHAALEEFFKSYREGHLIDLVGLEQIAFEFINETPANYWKLQKTTPTIEKCIEKATKTVVALLKNFIPEVGIYTDEIERVVDVEYHTSQFVTINGVDIPIPCNARLDLNVITKDGKNVIIDHKSKASFTDEKDLNLIVGKQAITYAVVYEAATGIKVDEVWFIENKYSKNKDGSPQLRRHKVVLDKDTVRLYEAMLYEPLKRMIEAISDPDYVYMINDNDSFVDKAELFEFWMQTMIAEVSDFDIPDSKKEMVETRLRKIRDSSLKTVSPKIIKDFKNNAAQFISYDLSNKDMTPSQKIEHVLRSFGIVSQVEHEFNGYSSNTFLISTSAGIPIKTIHKHGLDIANALNVNKVRIGKDLFVYRGKSYLAIESAKERDKDLFFDPNKLDGFKLPIGVDNFDQTIVWDLNNHSTPHMLICGETGSGKSICIISTIEYAKIAGVDMIIIFDPKNDEAFDQFLNDPKVEKYEDIDDIEKRMRELVTTMQLMSKKREKKKILIVFDEFADAVGQSKKGAKLKVFENIPMGFDKNGLPKFKREHTDTLLSLEENLQMLLQKGRSLGFRIISATQRASAKIINGDAKVNFPVQVCFRVPKETDSRVVIDEPGAESLAGKGDGLIKSPEYLDTVRFQGFYKK